MDHDTSEIAVRPGTAGDLDAVIEVQRASGTAAQWSRDDYLGFDLTVGEWDRRVVAFIASRRVACDEGEILNLAVHPEFQRRGFGWRLLRAILGSRESAWFLEVRASNQGAIDFYRAAGFQVAGRRAGYYSDPLEDAVVMRIGS